MGRMRVVLFPVFFIFGSAGTGELETLSAHPPPARFWSMWPHGLVGTSAIFFRYFRL